jgi:tetratricopeptide (TPR) repeat protein
LRDFNKAVTLAQDSVEAWYAKADLEYSLGKLKEAVASYIHALKISPASYDIWFTLAETYIELGEWLSALEAFDKCIMLREDDAKAIYEKAKVNFILSRTEEALQCLKKAFELDPSIQIEFTNDYPEIKSSKLFKKLLGEN